MIDIMKQNEGSLWSRRHKALKTPEEKEARGTIEDHLAKVPELHPDVKYVKSFLWEPPTTDVKELLPIRILMLHI